MPSSKPKPSEIATEAKRLYIPWIQNNMPNFPANSIMFPDSHQILVPVDRRTTSIYPRVAIMDADPVDLALQWYDYALRDPASENPAKRIPVVNMANERRAGGDWESGFMAPEECFARRSNLVPALKEPHPIEPHTRHSPNSHYPIPPRGGMYSPSVVVFRDGADHYEVWNEFKWLPVITVAPVRRPKLDVAGIRYSFDQERDLMQEKMRTILRIAAWNCHQDVCLGPFGTGPVFKNPVREVAEMWKELLFEESEFRGAFKNIIFAIDAKQPGSSKNSKSDLDVFNEVFDPSRIFQTNYR